MPNALLSQGILPLIVGITGHRDLRPDDVPRLETAVREALRELKENYPHTPLLILSPLGEGADRLVARVGLAEGASLCVPLPMTRTLYEAEFESDASRAEFAELLAKANDVFTLPWLDCNDVKAANCGPSGPHVAQQYAQMGAYIARHSQVFLALWDGQKSNEMLGGTSQIVRFRLEGAPPPYGPPQSLLDPADSAPVIHIVTPRQSNPQPDGAAFSRQDLLPPGTDAADRDRAFANLDKFNADAAANPAAQEAGASINMLLPTEDSVPPMPSGVQAFLQTFGLADALSIHFQRHMTRTLERVFSAVLVAALCFNLFHSLPHASHEKHGGGHGETAATHGESAPGHASDSVNSPGAIASHAADSHGAAHAPVEHAATEHAPADSHAASAEHSESAAAMQEAGIDEPLIDMGHLAGIPWFLWLYLLVVAGNVLFHRRAEKQEFQNKYQDYRALAEGLRVQIFWGLAGLSDEAADYYLGKQRSELDWIRHALRVRNVLSDTASQGNSAGMNADSLLLVQKHWIQEQQRYFIRKTHRELEDLEHCEKRIETLLMFSVGLTVALAITLAAPVFVPWPPLETLKLWIEEPLTHGLVMISIVMLAVCAGLLHGYNQLKARAEHAKRYGRMAVLFDNAARHFERLMSSGQTAEVPALLRELGKEALAENADWVMLHRERPLQVPHAA